MTETPTETGPEDCAQCGTGTSAICEHCHADRLTAEDYLGPELFCESCGDSTHDGVELSATCTGALVCSRCAEPSTDDLSDWDYDRLLFHVGELESQVARLTAEQARPEGTVTVTLTTEQAEVLRNAAAYTIDQFNLTDHGWPFGTPVLIQAHDEIVGALPRDEVEP